MKEIKKHIMLLFVIFSLTILSNSCLAVFWACFNEGELIDYCHPGVPDRTAPRDGYMLCMSSFNNESQCFIQGNHNACNTIPQECSYTGNASIDSEPPEMVVVEPVDG